MSTPLHHKKKISVIKPTPDNWCDNDIIEGPDGKQTRVITISLIKDYIEEPIWRITAWGNDDMGLEKEYTNEDEAVFTFCKIIAEPTISQKFLKDIGFITA